MAAFIIVLILVIVGLVGYMVWASVEVDSYPSEPAPTEEELLQARLDLHRIERGVDLTLAKQEQRREGERTKEAIAEALEGDQR
ncbi:MAG: hypothetical protein AB7V58_06375 [Solirubrobacterales bacterium]